MIEIIKRDILVAWRSGGAWAHGLLFFVLFTSLCAIGLGGDKQLLTPIGGALIWLSVILSLLLSFDRAFADDAHDGSLDQMALSQSLMSISAAKLIGQWVLSVLPLLLIVPFAGYSFGLTGPEIAGLFNALLIGSPALLIYSTFAGACLLGYRNAGFLVILLTVPLIIPTLIFGLSAVDSFALSGIMSAPYKALAGISLLSVALGLPAMAGALRTYLETS